MVKPFLPWVGGKQRLVSKLRKCVPSYSGVYYEPFLGAGSLLLSLMPPRAVVGDVNAELINTYQVLQSGGPTIVQQLQTELQTHSNDERHYYQVRDHTSPADLEPLQRAARFVYLMRTCYAGLYRENKSGKFNVSYSKVRTTRHDSVTDIIPVAAYLQTNDVRIVQGDFRRTLKDAAEGDFVYLDPPYYPSTATSFTSYHRGSGFDYSGLRETFLELNERGCHVLMSNSDCEPNRASYADFIVDEFSLGRTIRPELSKGRRELLICNYDIGVSPTESPSE